MLKVNAKLLYGNDFLFLKSKDGMKYEIIAKLLPCGEKATEACLLFEGDTVIAVARGINDKARYGVSKFPYITWEWTKMDIAVGGPALLKLPNGKLVLGTRNYQEDFGMTSLYWLRERHVKKIMTLNKDKDSSYPSFALVNNNIYVSYYSGDRSITSVRFFKSSLDFLDGL